MITILARSRIRVHSTYGLFTERLLLAILNCMTTLYKAVDPLDDIPVTHVGCYVLKWGRVDQPSVGFVPVEIVGEDAVALAFEALKAARLAIWDHVPESAGGSADGVLSTIDDALAALESDKEVPGLDK